MLTPQEIEHLARLIRVELNPDEHKEYLEQLSHIIEYLSVLKETDTTDVAATHQVTERVNAVRPDHVEALEDPAALIAAAPDQENSNIRAPLVRKDSNGS